MSPIEELNGLLDRYVELQDQPLSNTLQRLKQSHSVREADPTADEVPSTEAPAAGDTNTTAPFTPVVDPTWPMIPDYIIEAELGVGGMGVVYKAKRSLTGHLVAIKVIRPEYAGIGDWKNRFIREATVMCHLRHPNIVIAHDAFDANGPLRLIMEFLDGVNLHDFVKRNGRLAYPEACDLIAQSADGLHYAHTLNVGNDGPKGVIHRDIKPNNLFRTPDGKIKILDFGLARCMEGISQSQHGVGTIGYISPEQGDRDGKPDHRTDIYSLGKTLFFLLTGQHEHTAKKSLAELRPDLPLELVAICERMMAKDADLRPASAAEVANEMRRFVTAVPVATPAEREAVTTVPLPTAVPNREQTFVNATSAVPTAPAPAARSLRLPLIAGSAVAVSLIGITFLVWALGGFGGGNVQNKKNNGDNLIVEGKGNTDVPKPNGKPDNTPPKVEPGPQDALFAKQGKDVIVFEHPAEVTCVAFSPDGKSVVTGCKNGDVHHIDLEIGKMRKSPPAPWASLGITSVVYLSEHKVFICYYNNVANNYGVIWNLQNNEFAVKKSTELKVEPSGSVGHLPRYAAVSEETHELVVSHSGGQLGLIRKNGEWAHTLKHSKDLMPSAPVSISRDGKWVLSAYREKLWNTDNPQNPHWWGQSKKENSINGSTVVQSLSPDGTHALIAVAEQDKVPRILNIEFPKKPDGEHIRKGELVGQNVGSGFSCVTYSPDGLHALSGSKELNPTVRLWDLTTYKEIKKLEGHQGLITCVAFTPDGRYALSGSTDKTLRFWKLLAKSKLNPEIWAAKQSGDITAVAFSADGKRAYSGSGDGWVRQWDADTGKELTQINEFRGRFGKIRFLATAPEGPDVYLASHDDEKKNWQFCVWDAGKKSVAATKDRFNSIVGGAAFSADGRRVVLGYYASTIMCLYSVPQWEIVARLSQSNIASVAISKDGTRMLAATRYWQSGSHRVMAWSSASPEKPIFDKEFKHDPIRVALTPEGTEALITVGNRLELWDLTKGEKLREFTGHTETILGLAISADGSLALSCSRDKTVRLWDVKKGAEIKKLDGHTHDVTAVAFSPDGIHALSGGNDKTLRKWKLPAAAEPVGEAAFQKLQLAAADLRSVTFTADGNTVIAGSRGSIHEWNWRTGQKKQTDDANCTGAFSVSTDRKKILYGIGTETLGLYDVASGKASFFTDVQGHVNHAAFSPDGRKGLIRLMRILSRGHRGF